MVSESIARGLVPLVLCALLGSFVTASDGSDKWSPLRSSDTSRRMTTNIVGVPSVAQIMSLLKMSETMYEPHGDTHQQRRQRRNNQQGDLPGSDLKPRTGYRVASFSESLPPGFGEASNSSNKMGCYYFNVSAGIPSHARVHYAVLTIFRRCKSGSSTASGVNVSLVPDSNASPASQLHDSVNMNCEGRNGGDWLRIIVTPFVQRWLIDDDHRSICLLSPQAERTPRMALFSLQGGNLKAGKNRNASLTVIYELQVLGDQPTCTPATEYESTSKDNARQTCCRKPYYIDFSTTRWRDNILFPSGYDAYACHGWCPRESPPASSQLQFNDRMARWFALVHRQCEPTRFTSVMMMIRTDQDRLALETIPNAVVLSCGCAAKYRLAS